MNEMISKYTKSSSNESVRQHVSWQRDRSSFEHRRGATNNLGEGGIFLINRMRPDLVITSVHLYI